MTGISTSQAKKLIESNGTNTFAKDKKSQPVKIFIGQFKDVMVMILLVATVISVLLGEIYDSITIILIVLLNAILGFIQEYRTEKTLETLKKITSPTAKVYRDGHLTTIDASQIVVSDVIEIDTGDRVPADCVILSSSGVFADESVLTGEPVPVSKSPGNISDNDNSLNKSNILYAGTIITKGHSKARVIAAGKGTQMGKISHMISEIQNDQTPLQKRLGELGKVVALICMAVCIIVFLAGIMRGEDVFTMLMTGITIAIAAIPEGLPATVTISLALAVSRMLKQKALVNKLHSVETLGCTSVICSDKTGTITENKMTVTDIFTDMREFRLNGLGYKISGSISTDASTSVNPVSFPTLNKLLKSCVLCNNASISSSSAQITRNRGNLSATGEWSVTGDPTEIALLIAAAKGNIRSENIMGEYKIVDEDPFDSQTRCMSVTVKCKNGDKICITKGAPDVILDRCSFIEINKEVRPLTPGIKTIIEDKFRMYSDDAKRVLAFSTKLCSSVETSPGGMVFLGLTAMIDPLREEAKKAIKVCHSAHIETVMITGDHKNTAVAIAKQAGILRDKKAITGSELDAMSDSMLQDTINQYSVFARVNPSHKLRLVKAYKARGCIVTMTGDGVNDAPAIKEANVGVSMGITGTDVTKQAADVVLLDDNFATLVHAVEQGRCIYTNIKKFVRYLLSCNIGEVLTMFAGIIMGYPIVLLPTQLLLVNLITDGLPAVCLSMEPLDRNEMKKAPRRSTESFFAGGLMSRIVFRGILIGICTLGSFSTVLRLTGNIDSSRTAALITLIISQLIHVFECKSEKGNIFTVSYFNNMKLIGAVLLSLIIVSMSVYFPPLQLVFGTVALSRKLLGIALAFSASIPVLNCIISLFNNNKD
ncbi:MAG: cation-translocating P-type ATPase [Oscillospiraceae bacterium]|nr:cation-translocating P-type ATPase [Oscillospiraceae bacterium]